MQIRKIIQERIRGGIGGTKVDGDVNASIAANVGERGAVTRVSSTSGSGSGDDSGTSEHRHDTARNRGRR
jgi:hypothetical protein